MKEYTCKDCRHWQDEGTEDAVCNAHNMFFWKGTPLCQYFETKDGKRPRFCRLASCVDEMAAAMVWDSGGGDYSFWGCEYESKKEAIAAAKNWLMKVE